MRLEFTYDPNDYSVADSNRYVTDDDAFEVDDEYLLIGRTYEEYAAMFGVDELSGRVLDCGSGVSSFVVEARERGIDAIGVDPTYTDSRGTLATDARRARRDNVAQLSEKRDRYVWSFYGGLDERGDYLERASERFLDNFPDGPYVAAGLPELPFRDDTFDLAVSGNLLFLYDDRLDLEFHVAAVQELARVADEVRVFPLASLDRTQSQYVEPCLEKLRAAGHTPELRDVSYEFQPGATTVLVI